MTSATTIQHTSRISPPLFGSLGYLLLNLPLGIVSFTGIVTLGSVGLGTAIIWVGLPILALTVLGVRGMAQLERARVYAMLDTHITIPYRRLPDQGQKARWEARLAQAATWRDLTYLVLLFPLGIAEFVLTVLPWSVGLGFAALPIYFRFLAGGAYYFPAKEIPWITVDSTLDALPWAALGALVVAMSIALTRALGMAHARFARALLGPTRSTLHQHEHAPVVAGAQPSRLAG